MSDCVDILGVSRANPAYIEVSWICPDPGCDKISVTTSTPDDWSRGFESRCAYCSMAVGCYLRNGDCIVSTKIFSLEEEEEQPEQEEVDTSPQCFGKEVVATATRITDLDRTASIGADADGPGGSVLVERLEAILEKKREQYLRTTREFPVCKKHGHSLELHKVKQYWDKFSLELRCTEET